MESRLPMHKRAQHPPPMNLTARDQAICAALYQYRVLRRDQLQTLFFTGRSATNRVLSRLYHHGYLRRRFLPNAHGLGLSYALYTLEQKGAAVAAQKLGIAGEAVARKARDPRLSTLWLKHSLRINDTMIAIRQAAARAGYSLERWLDEATLRQPENRDYVYLTTAKGKRKRVAVIADQFFTVRLGERTASFFLEVDNATLSLSRWRQRVRAYCAYIQSGKYQARYRTNALRILTVTTSPQRRQNLKATTEAAAGQGYAHLFWFTHFAQLAHDVLAEPIWAVAGKDSAQVLISPPRKAGAVRHRPEARAALPTQAQDEPAAVGLPLTPGSVHAWVSAVRLGKDYGTANHPTG